jgi:hypothetical protein
MPARAIRHGALLRNWNSGPNPSSARLYKTEDLGPSDDMVIVIGFLNVTCARKCGNFRLRERIRELRGSVGHATSASAHPIWS